MRTLIFLLLSLGLFMGCGSESEQETPPATDSSAVPPPQKVKVLDLEAQPDPEITPGEGGLSGEEATKAIANLPEVLNELEQAPQGGKREVLLEQEATEEDRYHYVKCVETLSNGVKNIFFRFRIHADEGNVDGYYKPNAEYVPLKDWRSRMNPKSMDTPVHVDTSNVE